MNGSQMSGENVAEKKTNKIFTPYDKETREIIELLCKKFSIPGGVHNFTVSFAINEPVSVTCTYTPYKQESEEERFNAMKRKVVSEMVE
jgi:hypothetical protein